MHKTSRGAEPEGTADITIRRFHGSVFLNEAHRQRMERTEARIDHARDTPALFAALYLLTAEPDIHLRSINCFCRQGIQFGQAEMKGISAHSYTLFSAARDIYTDTSGVALNDLASREIVDRQAFDLIVNALFIARNGPSVLREGAGR